MSPAKVQYDPTVIVAEAERLYQLAGGLPASWAIRGGLAGAVLGVVLGGMLGLGMHEPGLGAALGAVLVAALLAIGGWRAGIARAFFLRLEAQRLLVFAQIEMNTRPR